MNKLTGNDFSSIFGDESIPMNPGDYWEGDTLYCGKCHEDKTMFLDSIFGRRRVMCTCKCMRDAYEEQQRRSKEDALRIKARRLREIGFHEAALKDYCFEKDDNANQYVSDAMRNYVDDFSDHVTTGQGILLYGACGTGKTFAAVCVANALLDKGIPVVVTSMSRIATEISKSNFNKGDYIERLDRCELLIIDDLGRERKTDFMTEIVGEVIDSRVRAKKPMIVTTNLTLQEIKEPKDIDRQRIYDRIIQTCMPLEVVNENRRYASVRETYEQKKAKMFRARPRPEQPKQEAESLEIPF